MEFLLFKDGVFHTIRTETNPLGQGGEGAIYRIIYPEKLNTHCVKIYYPNKITAEKQNKLTYLSEHTPITDSKGHKSVIWVEGIVYDTKQNFLGICMPIAKGYSLEYLSVSKFPQKRIKPEELKNYKKFDREHKNNITARIAVCHNIAIAVGQLHHSQQYVHGDIKPENIIFDANSRVSIIDFDTVQVSEQNTLIYPMLAQTPEYIPPIYQNANLKNTIVAPFMDIFSMTVIFYRILLGIHPFASTNFKVPYQNITTIPEAIQAKLLHFGKNSSYFTQINAMHKKFSEFPKSLRELFTEVLENENTAIRAADWIDVIKNPEVLQTLNETLNSQKTSVKIQGITLNNDNTLLIPLYSASNKTWGYCTIDKKTVIPCEYDYVTEFSQNNLASVQKGQYSGVIDKTGKTIIPFVYKNTWIVKDVIIFTKDGVKSAVHVKNSKSLPAWYKYIHEDEENNLLYVDNRTNKQSYHGYEGVFNLDTLDVIVPVKNHNVYNISDGLIRIRTAHTTSFVDKNGKVVISPRPYYISDFSEGMAVTREGRWHGYINKDSEEVIPKKYMEAKPFGKEGLAEVGILNKYGVVNKAGEEIVPVIYSWIKDLSDGMIVVREKRKYGAINHEGNVTVPLKYSDISNFSNGTAVAKIGQRVGLIDKQNNEILPFKYENIIRYQDGFWVMEKDKANFIDLNGNMIILSEYKNPKCFYASGYHHQTSCFFNNGMAILMKNGKYGVINQNNEIIVPFHYDNMYWIDIPGYLYVSIAEKHGIIDLNNNIVVPLIYDDVRLIDENLAEIRKEDKHACINIHTGQEVIKMGRYRIVSSDLHEDILLLKKEFLYSDIEEEIYIHKNGTVYECW